MLAEKHYEEVEQLPVRSQRLMNTKSPPYLANILYSFLFLQYYRIVLIMHAIAGRHQAALTSKY